MEHTEASALMERLLADPELRTAFARDPRLAAQQEGLALTDDDVRALQAVDWSDEALATRVSKGTSWI